MDRPGLPPPIRSEWVDDLAFKMSFMLNKLLNKMRQEPRALNHSIAVALKHSSAQSFARSPHAAYPHTPLYR